MKCSHNKAKKYLANCVSQMNDEGFVVQVKCRRCNEMIGQEAANYPLPRDFSEMKGIYSISTFVMRDL